MICFVRRHRNSNEYNLPPQSQIHPKYIAYKIYSDSIMCRRWKPPLPTTTKTTNLRVIRMSSTVQFNSNTNILIYILMLSETKKVFSLFYSCVWLLECVFLPKIIAVMAGHCFQTLKTLHTALSVHKERCSTKRKYTVITWNSCYSMTEKNDYKLIKFDSC